MSDILILPAELAEHFDEDDGTSEMLQDNIWSALDLCGCGNHALTLEFISEGMRILKITDDDDSDEGWTRKWEEQKKFESKYQGGALLLWYFLTNMGFAEHGGSIPGWLTDSGRFMFEKITEWKHRKLSQKP